MFVARFFKCTTALLGTLAILISATVSLAQGGPSQDEEQQNQGFNHQELTLREKVALLRQRVKYVFVIFHENESFDHFFGTFPGANGLFFAPQGATPANATPSFVQKYLDTSLNTVTISPFLMPQAVTALGRADRADLSRRRDFGRSQPPGHGEQPAYRSGDRRRGE